MSNNTKPLITFLDNIGRIILGKKVAEDADTITIENPALVHIQPNPQTNQLQLQLLPIFFKEFLSDGSQSTEWEFKRSNITMAKNIEFNPQFASQYEVAFAPKIQPPTNKEPEVVKLFDDEEEKK